MRSATRLLIAAGWVGPVFYLLWLAAVAWRRGRDFPPSGLVDAAEAG